MSQGFRHVRVQVGVPGMAGYGAATGRRRADAGTASRGPVFEPAYYYRRAMKLFEACRTELGEEVELLHDVHERVSPNQGVQFCKDAEKFKLFFVEDPVSPEDIAYFRQIRQQCSTPLAMGELFNSPHEWTAADRGAADRLHPHPRVAGGRPHAVPQDRGLRRAVRREDRVARPGRRLPDRPHGERSPRRRLLQLRHQRVLAVQPEPPGDLQGLPGDEERLPLLRTNRRAGASRWTRSSPRTSRSARRTANAAASTAAGAKCASATGRSSSSRRSWARESWGSRLQGYGLRVRSGLGLDSKQALGLTADRRRLGLTRKRLVETAP